MIFYERGHVSVEQGCGKQGLPKVCPFLWSKYAAPLMKCFQNKLAYFTATVCYASNRFKMSDLFFDEIV
jgi:hypothetical protein